MDDVTIARAVHVLFAILWIGGVGFVTTVLLPAIRRLNTQDQRLAIFDSLERRFARQAQISTVLVGATGLYMVVRLDLWNRFLYVNYWWMHAMVCLWLLFTVLLFIAEPLFLHRWFHERAKAAPEATFHVVAWLHRLLLALSIVTILGAVAGSHGLLFFD